MANGELSKIEKAIASAADNAVADAISLVRQHPEYVQAVQSLAEKALASLLADL
jgi:hypothetical protein